MVYSSPTRVCLSSPIPGCRIQIPYWDIPCCLLHLIQKHRVTLQYLDELHQATLCLHNGGTQPALCTYQPLWTMRQSQKGVGEFLLEEGDDLLHQSPCDFAVISNNHALFPSISAIDPYQQSKFDLDNEDATVSEDQRLNNCFILLLCFTFQLASKQLSIDHIDQVKRQVSFSLCSSNRNN